jgi:hypothetical protein
MGLFKTLGNGVKGFAKASEEVREFVTETFISPVAREAMRPVVNVRSGIDGMVPGGRDSGQAVNTPFGVVKPFANVQKVAQGQSAKQQGALTPGQAVMGAAEVLTAGPSGTLKAFAKPAGKLISTVDKFTGIGNALRGSAVKSVEQVLTPGGGSKPIKQKAAKIAGELLDRGVTKTTAGLKRYAKEGMQEAGRQFDELGKLPGRIKVAPVLKAFDTAKNALVMEGKIVDQVGYRALEEVSKVISQYGDDMAAETMRGIKQIFDDKIAKAGKGFGLTLADTDLLTARKIGANSIRELLAKQFPDVAEVNKSFSFFKNLDEVLEATKGRKTGHTGLAKKGVGAFVMSKVLKPFGTTAEAAGAVMGGALADTVTGTLAKLTTAQAKSRFADILLEGSHSLPKIAELVKTPVFAKLKWKDALDYLEEKGKMTEEEKASEDAEREERIEQIRSRFDDSDGNAAVASPATTGPARAQRIDEIKKRLLEAQP